MASNVTPHKDGYRTRWSFDGRMHQIFERDRADAARAQRWVTERGNKIADTDPLIKGKAYLYGTEAAVTRVATANTVESVLEAYCAAQRGAWVPATESRYRQAIALHFSSWLARPVASIGAADLNERYAYLVAAGRKPTTVVNILGVAKALLVFAHGHSLTRYNPRSKADADRLTFKLHGVGAGHTSPRDAITRATFLQLREYVPAGQWVVFLTMVTIGARIGEMAGLRCGDVDLNGVHPTITITTQIQGTDRLDWTKGDAGGRRPKAARALPITAELAAMLAPLIEGRSMDAPLFVHTSPRSKRLRSGGFWSPNSWRLQVFDTTIAKARAAGVILPATFVPHSLRHSMATWLSEKLTPQQLMLRMRHANIGMTMRYFHDNAAGRAIEHAAVENMLTLAA